ncbi:MAG: NAD(P)-dependent oxidoreductase [Salibacteraceae bacterium]
MKIGIIMEGKIPVDERVPLTPEQVRHITDKYSEIEIYVQSSDIRRIKDSEYEALGIPVVDDVSHCDVLLGVKEVPVEQLIPNKTYYFFSHTIKMQPYNKPLLAAIVENDITLVDWECLRDAQGRRLIGFGRHAGLVGAYNGLRMIGEITGKFSLKPAYTCDDEHDFFKRLDAVRLEPMNILLTGRGKVAKGALEVLSRIGVEQVGIREFLTGGGKKPQVCQITFTDYFKHVSGKDLGHRHFLQHPEEYRSDFMRFAEVTDFFIAGHYWDPRAPYLFTREDCRKPEFRIKYVADISCDIDGPVACTIRPSTIDHPFYGYDPQSEKETSLNADGAIAVMAVDNLPCELPKAASREFGKMFLHAVLPSLLNGDKLGIIHRATIVKKGEITPNYSYLREWLNQ